MQTMHALGQQTKVCSVCKENLPEGSFTRRMWMQGDEERKCKKYGCMDRTRGIWRCVQCKMNKPKAEFAAWLAGKTSKYNHGSARCNECDQKQKEDDKHVARASMSQGMARR